MVKIRLQRTGAKNQAKFRIVVSDKQIKRNGRSLEIIGHYDPIANPPSVVLQPERYDFWKDRGAQPTLAVINLLKRYEKISRTNSKSHS